MSGVVDIIAGNLSSVLDSVSSGDGSVVDSVTGGVKVILDPVKLDELGDWLRVEGIGGGRGDGLGLVSVAVVLGSVGWVDGRGSLNDVWGSLGDVTSDGLGTVDNLTSMVVGPVSGGIDVLAGNLGSMIEVVSSNSGSSRDDVSSGVGSLRHTVLSLVKVVSEPVEVLELNKVVHGLRVHGVSGG